MVFFFRVCGVGFGLVFCYGFGGGVVSGFSG